MEVLIAGHGIAVETAGEWAVVTDWDAEAQATHGIYFGSIAHGVQIHMRSQPPLGHPLTPQGLVELLHAQQWLQQWASAPFDQVTRVVGALTIVAATFEMDRGFVREFFATDGQMLASATMPCTGAQLAAARDSVERLVASIRFTALK